MRESTPRMDYPWVEVVWLDSQSEDAAWQDRDDAEDPTSLECRSVGYLIRDLPDRVVLAMGFTQNQWLNRFEIPKSAIVSRTEPLRIDQKAGVRLGPASRYLFRRPSPAARGLKRKDRR